MRYHERYTERRERRLKQLIQILLVALAAALIGLAMRPSEAAKSKPEPELTPSVIVRVVREEPEMTTISTSTEPVKEEPEEIKLPDYIPTWDELKRLAKLVYGEARGVESQTEQAAIIWCVLNRIDAGYGETVTEVVHAAHFHGYSPNHPLTDDFGRDLEELAADVVSRWLCEKMGDTDVGRVIPPEFLWFESIGGENVFRNAYKNGDAWDWRLPSPYES